RVYETVTGGDDNPNPPYLGNGWIFISTPFQGGWTVGDPIDTLAIAAADGNTIYAATGGGIVAGAQPHIFVTFNHGATWQQVDVPGVTDHYRQLLVDPTDPQTAYVVRDRFGGGHVFRTQDGGQSWTDISGDLPDLPTNTIALDPRVAPNTLYVGTDRGAYPPTAMGLHWSAFQMGLPNVEVVDLKLAPSLNILAAATHGRGVWEILVEASAPWGVIKGR